MHGFTGEDTELLGRVIEQCWDQIADDMFYDDHGKRDYSKAFSRGDVAEISLDAERYTMLTVYTEEELTHIKLLVKFFYSLEENQREDVLKEALHYSVYGY